MSKSNHSQSVGELLERRNRRLQTILKLLLAVGLLGVLSTIPSFIFDDSSSDMGKVSFVALTILWIFYAFCFWLTHRGRHDLARNLLFACWIIYAFVQVQLYDPGSAEPLLGVLFMSIGQVFYAVVLGASYVLTMTVKYMTSVEHMNLPRMFLITVGVCFMLLVCVAAFARAFTSDLNQLLEHSEEARDTERELREQTEVARDNAMKASLVKSQFLANMSHELRTPLSAIIGYVELIREESEDLDMHDFDGDLGQIKSAATHLHGLINDILDLSKIEAGKLEIVTATTSLSGLIDDVVATVRPLIEKNDNVFSVEMETTHTTLFCDEVRCKQALLNLLSNAAKFTSEGSVTLRIMDSVPLKEGSPAHVMFEVKDTGIGIDADKIEKIFAPFEQADGSTTRQYGGTGLGLPISVRLVEMMGGALTVESTPGYGSTFCISLPVEEPTLVS